MGLYAGSSYVDKLRSAVRVFSAMLTWALENAIDTGDSMKARGYGLKGRSHFALFRFTLRDALLLSAAALLLTLVFLGMMLKKTAFSFYPRITPLNTAPLAVIAYIAFGALAFLPFVIEAAENMRWKALLSRVPQKGLTAPDENQKCREA